MMKRVRRKSFAHLPRPTRTREELLTYLLLGKTPDKGPEATQPVSSADVALSASTTAPLQSLPLPDDKGVLSRSVHTAAEGDVVEVDGVAGGGEGGHESNTTFEEEGSTGTRNGEDAEVRMVRLWPSSADLGMVSDGR